MNINKVVTTPMERQLRKLEKAFIKHYELNDKFLEHYSADKSIKDFPEWSELCLNHLKVLNHILPTEILEDVNKRFSTNRALKYYRERYGQEGVTEVANRFTTSKPFLRNYTLKYFYASDAETQKSILDKGRQMLRKRGVVE